MLGSDGDDGLRNRLGFGFVVELGLGVGGSVGSTLDTTTKIIMEREIKCGAILKMVTSREALVVEQLLATSSEKLIGDRNVEELGEFMFQLIDDRAGRDLNIVTSKSTNVESTR